MDVLVCQISFSIHLEGSATRNFSVSTRAYHEAILAGQPVLSAFAKIWFPLAMFTWSFAKFLLCFFLINCLDNFSN